MEKDEYVRTYVRTTDGIIGKIENYDNGEYWIRHSKDDIWKCSEDFIIKHSKNVIDLIENGDVLKVKTDGNEIVYIGIDENTIDISYKELLDEIKQSYKLLEILTKEQYEANCYSLEE